MELFRNSRTPVLQKVAYNIRKIMSVFFTRLVKKHSFYYLYYNILFDVSVLLKNNYLGKKIKTYSWPMILKFGIGA
jgi:uncharacterized protein YtpQ (UPF0354 family)